MLLYHVTIDASKEQNPINRQSIREALFGLYVRGMSVVAEGVFSDE